MITLPSFQTYGHYSNANYGAHCLRFTDGHGNNFWFSYQTLVAFQKVNKQAVVRVNDWGPTTGKHLNAIDGGAKSARVPGAIFEKLYHAAFKNRKAGAA